MAGFSFGAPSGDCERRLDSSTFFRASRGCIVNLSHVKQSRLLEDESVLFLLKDGKEVVLSRRQSVLFRKTRRVSSSGIRRTSEIGLR